MAGNLVGNPTFRNPATRSTLAEELRLTTYILGAGKAAAERDGEATRYAQCLHAFYRARTGHDLGAWKLTPAGFACRSPVPRNRIAAETFHPGKFAVSVPRGET